MWRRAVSGPVLDGGAPCRHPGRLTERRWRSGSCRHATAGPPQFAVLRWTAGCIIALAVAWLASGALPAPGERSGEAAGIPVPSDLEFARVLLEAGRPRHALAFLKQVEPADERDRLERHLLLGRVHMLLGNPEEAAKSYEAVLAVRPEMTPVRLEAARVLLEAGRPGYVLVFLEQAEPADERDRLERHLLLGRAHMLLGNPEGAAENYEAVLAIRPEETPIRLEAARANFLAGRDRRAKRHFKRVAKAELPEHVEAAVARYLAEIDRRKPWSATLSASLLPETNTVRRTDRETVEIGGIPFRLNEDARESSGIGVRIVARRNADSPCSPTAHRGTCRCPSRASSTRTRR